MLQLKNIKKVYKFADNSQTALNGVSMAFRRSEFVSILGPSGCGKTTLLNIIGGLDRYTDGDLIIKGRHTREYRDGDWDVYRNRSVGFVFQSYNLIPHQSILANVELAMTLSGISRQQRRERAKKALERVGLGDFLHKKPNQMSGGQMQRVAIARALVNDPEILLADEPTGALDSGTSVQIMELLSEIAKDRLVIMVTHNPELAERYSTRIIRLLDGKVVGDSNPYEPAEESAPAEKKKVRKKPMSFITATSLSLNNLMTKKARTFLTSFAGSIGIIGIALILALSNGITLYIDRVQEDTLSSYPLTIQTEAMDYSSMFAAAADNGGEEHGDDGKIHSNSNMTTMLNSMLSGMVHNDLKSLKSYLDDPANGISDLVSDVKYTYGLDYTVYTTDVAGNRVKVDTTEIIDAMYEKLYGIKYSDAINGMGSMSSLAGSVTGFDIMSEMIDNQSLLESQYDIIGSWPSEYNEVVLAVDKNNELTDMVLYALGLRDRSEINDFIDMMKNGEELPVEKLSFDYDDLIGMTFDLVPAALAYEDADGNGVYEQLEEDRAVGNAVKIKISGIVRPSEGALASSISGVLGYTKALTDYITDITDKSDAVKAQKENSDTDIFTGIKFPTSEQSPLTMDDVQAYISTLGAEEQAQYGALISGMDEKKVLEMFTALTRTSATYDGNLEKLGVIDKTTPKSVSIYPKDFESKEVICDKIDDFNAGRDENDKITYTDYVGLMMSSVTTIIDVISYVLIAFVSISLIVSSIMIGIITYISVLERTKEIGILRSIGASKKDVSRVFNAETLIVGFSAGIIGIGITLILTVPINFLIRTISGVSGVGAALPWQGGLALVLISCLLTFIAGLVPSRIAAKKDPVVALRTE